MTRTTPGRAIPWGSVTRPRNCPVVCAWAYVAQRAQARREVRSLTANRLETGMGPVKRGEWAKYTARNRRRKPFGVPSRISAVTAGLTVGHRSLLAGRVQAPSQA